MFSAIKAMKTLENNVKYVKIKSTLDHNTKKNHKIFSKFLSLGQGFCQKVLSWGVGPLNEKFSGLGVTLDKDVLKCPALR